MLGGPPIHIPFDGRDPLTSWMSQQVEPRPTATPGSSLPPARGGSPEALGQACFPRLPGEGTPAEPARRPPTEGRPARPCGRLSGHPGYSGSGDPDPTRAGLVGRCLGKKPRFRAFHPRPQSSRRPPRAEFRHPSTCTRRLISDLTGPLPRAAAVIRGSADRQVHGTPADPGPPSSQWPDSVAVPQSVSFADGGLGRRPWPAASCTRSASRSSRPARTPDGTVLRTAGRSSSTSISGRPSRPRAGASSYVLTPAPGSGKSLAYMVPIVDQRAASQGGRPGASGSGRSSSTPMNALANKPDRRAEAIT